MCLELALCADRLGNSPDNVVLDMAGLDVVWVASYQGHVFALFIFKADLPAIQKLRSRLNVG